VICLIDVNECVILYSYSRCQIREHNTWRRLHPSFILCSLKSNRIEVRAYPLRILNPLKRGNQLFLQPPPPLDLFARSGTNRCDAFPCCWFPTIIVHELKLFCVKHSCCISLNLILTGTNNAIELHTMVKKRPRPRSSIQTQISDRKARRKEERKSKKRKPQINEQDFNDWTKFREQEIQKEQEDAQVKSKPVEKPKVNKKKKVKTKDSSKKKKENVADIYDMVDEHTAAEMKKDDEEIAMLEQKLGLHKSGSDKKKLNKEYAKLEGYGEDFGDFLDGLDNMLVNVAGGEEYDEDIAALEYDSDESDQATARAKYLLRQDELQLGIDDSNGSKTKEYDSNDSSEDEETVPMKGPAGDDSSEEDDDGEASSESEEQSNSDERSEEDEKDDDESEDSDSDSEKVKERKAERDHDEKDIYHPVGGQDLYGNTIDNDQDQTKKPTKYIPPHLRHLQAAQAAANSKQLQNNDDELERKDDLRIIQKLLNNNLNRLSDNTLESVAKSITAIYKSSKYSTRDVNDKYWQNMRATCIPPHMIMTSLIPIYMACVSGVHFQAGDAVQLGGFVIEKVVLELWEEMKKKKDSSDLPDSSSQHELDDSDPLHSSKEASNLMMIICYLYNYNTIHCSLMYDIVRRLIKSFAEIDVELLLLILSHCGSQLRSDDPSALKDIVGLVQERSMEVIKMNRDSTNNNLAASSRAQFMISAITDLKNNKRRSADIAKAEKTSKYRRVIGRMKSASATGKRGDSLRLTVQDILDIETKGRWWVVGGTWLGNQHRHDDSNKQSTESITSNPDEQQNTTTTNVKEQKLLKLAAKQRMNTDLRRSIFCIIMGSDDCQDAFEKLVRSALLKGKSEREVVRVLVHCSGQEKVYNPYYAHLANRICDYQNKSKFTFQLCLWDAFKQFEDMKARKAANLAKLMAHLLMNLKLNLNVLKTIDISLDDMPESTIIFLTILFSNIFEAYDDPISVVEIFQRGEPTKEQLLKQANEAMENDDAFTGSGRQALKDSISIFLMHYLEKSPKNVKKSNFRKNLKAAIKACEEDNLEYMM
jgi:nucleolar MIF4G domain-containing protein 1